MPEAAQLGTGRRALWPGRNRFQSSDFLHCQRTHEERLPCLSASDVPESKGPQPFWVGRGWHFRPILLLAHLFQQVFHSVSLAEQAQADWPSGIREGKVTCS